jgi:hypothetical protein
MAIAMLTGDTKDEYFPINDYMLVPSNWKAMFDSVNQEEEKNANVNDMENDNTNTLNSKNDGDEDSECGDEEKEFDDNINNKLHT